MRSAETPYLADLFAISFRWLILFGLVVSLSLADQLNSQALIMVGFAALWNTLNTTIASINIRLPYHRQINLLADMFCSIMIFIVSGGIAGPVLWAGALAVSSASIYFLLPGSIIASVITSLLQAGYIIFQTSGNFSGLYLLLLMGLNIAAGLITGLLSKPLIQLLRANYQNITRQQKEAETKVVRAERDRLKTLFPITETKSGTLDYQTLLHNALDRNSFVLGVSSVEGKSLRSAFMLFSDGEFRIVSSHGFPPEDQETPLKAETGILRQAISTGSPQLTQDPGNDPELKKLIGLNETHSVYCSPLIHALAAIGVMIFAHPDPDFFHPDRRDILEMVSNQALIAIQNARLFQNITMEKERILSIQEAEQKKLARDLHDGPTQSISSIAMRLAIARKLMLSNPQEALEEITRVEEMARRTTEEMRHMLFTLRPLILETDGLSAAIQAIADKMADLYHQNVLVDIDECAAKEMDTTRQSVIFNLAEEAINNARKHSGASQVHVRLNFHPNEPHIVVFEVADNGKGFDVKEVLNSYERRGSLGMVNLREQSELIDGVLKIDSEPGKGTRIQVFIPLNQEAAGSLQRVK